MTTTIGELGITQPSVGSTGWGAQANTDLQTIDTEVSKLMRGKKKDAASLADSDTTPTVSNQAIVKTNSSGATSVTDFDDGTDEQFLVVIGADGGNTTIVHDGTNITLAGAASVVLEDDDILVLWLDSTNWVEVSRSIVGGITTSMIADDAVTGDKIASTTIVQGNMASSSVGTSQLKTSTTALSISAGSTQSFNTAYGHLPTMTTSGTPTELVITNNGTTGQVQLKNSGSFNASGTLRYHSSSPPHYLAGNLWGAFVWVHRRNGELLGYQYSVDPPWEPDEESRVFEKGDPRNIKRNPHPFQDRKDGDEIFLIDTRELDLEEVYFSEDQARAECMAIMGSKEMDIDLVLRARALKDVAEPRKMYAWQAREIRSRFQHGLLNDHVESLLESSLEPSSIKAGVEEFDSVVTIMRPKGE